MESDAQIPSDPSPPIELEEVIPILDAVEKGEWEEVKQLILQDQSVKFARHQLGHNMLHIVAENEVKHSSTSTANFEELLRLIGRESLQKMCRQKAEFLFGPKMTPLQLLAAHNIPHGITFLIDELDAKIVDDGKSIISFVAELMNNTKDTTLQEKMKKSVHALFERDWKWAQWNDMLRDKSLSRAKDPVSENKTLLHKCCKDGRSLPTVQLFIRKLADINETDGENKTPLSCVIQSDSPNRFEIIKLLLQHGAEFHESTKGAIREVIGNYEKDVMRVLHKYFPKEVKDIISDDTVLKPIIEHNHTDRLKWLLQIDRDRLTNALQTLTFQTVEGTTGNALHHACFHENYQMMEIILECGLNPTATNSKNATSVKVVEEKTGPFREKALTLLYGYLTVDDIIKIKDPCDMTLNRLKILLAKGNIHVNAKFPTQQNRTLLHIFCDKKPSVAIVQLLLEYGADTYVKDGLGNTPLQLLVESSGPPELLSVLLNHGASTGNSIEYLLKDGKGSLALLKELLKVREMEVLKALQKLIADAATVAGLVKSGQVQKLKFLHSAFPMQTLVTLADQPENGLHLACRGKNLELIHELLEWGIKANEKDGDGKTPVDYLESNEQLSGKEKKVAVELLRSRIKTEQQAKEDQVTEINKQFTKTREEIKGDLNRLAQDLPDRLSEKIQALDTKIESSIDRLKEMTDFIIQESEAFQSVEFTFYEIFNMISQALKKDDTKCQTFLNLLFDEYPQEGRDHYKRRIEGHATDKKIYKALLIWKRCQGKSLTMQQKLNNLKEKLKQSENHDIVKQVQKMEEKDTRSLQFASDAGSIFDQKNLNKLAKEVGGHWKTLGTNLEITNAELQDIEQKEPDTWRRSFLMLLTWSQKCKDEGVEKVAKLINAIKDCEREDLIFLLKQIEPVIITRSSKLCGIL